MLFSLHYFLLPNLIRILLTIIESCLVRDKPLHFQHYGFGLINLDLDGLDLFLQVSARVLHVPLQSTGMLTHRIDFGQLLSVKLARSI